MKKGILLIMILLLLTGCFNNKKTNKQDNDDKKDIPVNETREEKFNRLILQYYDEVFKNELEDDLIEVEFTLKHLKNHGMDVKDFENCDDTSKVVVTINKKKVASVKETDLICN